MSSNKGRPRENKDRFICTKLGKMQEGKKVWDVDNTSRKVCSAVLDLQTESKKLILKEETGRRKVQHVS